MKKLVVVGLILAAGAVFGLESYTVQNVTRRVEQEIRSGTWEAVKAGDVLSGETILRTGIDASVTVTAEGQTSVIGAMKNGAVAVLAGDTKGTGVRIGGQVSRTDTGTADRNTGRISTASARAGDAAGELPTDEE
jgi:type IV secretory pathway TrbL component